MAPRIPLPLLTDSYKTTHPFIYPDALKMVAYGEFRKPFEKDPNDTRIVLYGLRYIIEEYINVPWTKEDVDRSKAFFDTHQSSLNPADRSTLVFPFPYDLFMEFINENRGYFPVKIEALPEGSVIYPHIPVYQITAEKRYSRLVTYLETILTMIWYPCTVATLSRRCRDVIHEYFMKTADPEQQFLLDSRLHDFGFRGCTSVEQSIIGGSSHLVGHFIAGRAQILTFYILLAHFFDNYYCLQKLNFTGTDTLSAAYYTQFHLNNGQPVASSIPATEHSVMTSFRNERQAMERLLTLYGTGICACVMDSYDYINALENVLPTVAKLKIEKGGALVLRPDSGDPVEVVLQALRAAEKVFGVTVNKMGYKCLNGVSVIQGDGISHRTIGVILEAMEKEKYSAVNAAFGMGAGLLQKVNRDTMSFATKLSHITYSDGLKRDVMKCPKTDPNKISLPGEFIVVQDTTTLTPTVYPTDGPTAATKPTNALVTLYDSGRPVAWKWESFNTVRERLNKEWTATAQSKKHDAVSKELKDKIVRVKGEQDAWNVE
ncbi:hypothetical protein HDU67_003153 [Dinochytrium kinnereticum]|nr:hypothetical protein HDU67_003153 [Dinochytrium kinnereticum]